MKRDKKMINFVPSSPGCVALCPIENAEHKRSSEICCDAARQCCFFCFEDECPIKEMYQDIIAMYGGFTGIDDDREIDKGT